VFRTWLAETLVGGPVSWDGETCGRFGGAHPDISGRPTFDGFVG